MIAQSLSGLAGLLIIGRLLVGGMLLLAGLLKYKAGVHWFWRQILDYRLIRGKPAHLLACSLPGLEILCGGLLLLGILTPFVVVISFILLGGFTAAVSSTLWRGQAVECGCFGSRINSRTHQAQWTIAYRNLGLMALLPLIYHFGPGYLALDAWLWPVSIPNTQLLFWLVLLWGLLVVSIVWLKSMKKFLTVLAFLCVFLAVFAACSPSNIAPIADVIASSTHAPTAVAITLSPTGQQPIPASAASATAVTTPPLSTPTREPATSVATPTPFAPPMTEELTFTQLNQQGGAINSVAVVGQTAFVGAGSRLVIVDITDTAAPQTLGQSEVLPGLARAVLVRDGRAYVGAGSSIITLDISDPRSPSLLGEQTLSEQVLHLALHGETLIAATVSWPSEPQEIGSGMIITLDVNRPEQLQLLDAAVLPWYANAIALAEGMIYTSHPAKEAFLALDITTPDNLSTPVSFPVAALTYSLQAQDEMLYVGGGLSDVTAWDISDLMEPQKQWEIRADPDPDFGLGVVNGFVFVENYAYLSRCSQLSWSNNRTACVATT